MNQSDAIYDLEKCGYQLKCMVEAVGAIHAAMAGEHSAAESYTDALYGVYVQLQRLAGEVLDGVNRCFTEYRRFRGVSA